MFAKPMAVGVFFSALVTYPTLLLYVAHSISFQMSISPYLVTTVLILRNAKRENKDVITDPKSVLILKLLKN